MAGNTTFMWKVLRMPMEFFSQRMAGDIQGRQASNAMIAEQLVETFAPLALNAVMMVFYLVTQLQSKTHGYRIEGITKNLENSPLLSPLQFTLQPII